MLTFDLTKGLSLLTLSAQESGSLTPDTTFSCRLYVHALTYLLRGLPSPLSQEEELSLSAAIPLPLAQDTVHLAVAKHSPTATSSSDSSTQPSSAQPSEPTILHRLTASLILHLFLFLSFLWPHIQLFASAAHRYEREHHISERLLANALTTADVVTRRTVAATHALCAVKDGKVGEMLSEVAMWWAQGISSGVYEGVVEGMEVLGLKVGTAKRTGELR